MGFLQPHEVDDGAEIIAEMQIARRLDARKNPFNDRHGQLPADNYFTPAGATRVANRRFAPSIAMGASVAQAAGPALPRG